MPAFFNTALRRFLGLVGLVGLLVFMAWSLYELRTFCFPGGHGFACPAVTLTASPSTGVKPWDEVKINVKAPGSTGGVLEWQGQGDSDFNFGQNFSVTDLTNGAVYNDHPDKPVVYRLTVKDNHGRDNIMPPVDLPVKVSDQVVKQPPQGDGSGGGTGAPGTQGPKGDKGDKGDTGATGPAGQQGPAGAAGAAGAAGTTGATGTAGATGTSGTGTGSASASATSTSAGGFWGPAGKAPQEIKEAAKLLGTDPGLMYVLYPRPEDDTVIGWGVGTTYSERALGQQITINHIPAGTCVDFDHNATTVTGTTAWSERLTPMWTRNLMATDGSAKGLKVTIYWTSCPHGDGSITPLTLNQQGGQTAPAPVATATPAPQSQVAPPSATNACPTSPAQAATLAGGGGTAWSLLPGSDGTRWYYKGAEVTLTAPTFGKLDAPDGTFRNGQMTKTTEATFWCRG